jgi:thiol-disulfide isomerase/thioredoxin
MNKTIITIILFFATYSLGFSQSAEGIKVAEFFERLEAIEQDEDDQTLYVINFWATWCKPCVEELPHFLELHKDYQDQGVELILVSLDFEGDLEKKVIPFAKKRGIEAQIWMLTDYMRNMSWIDKVSPEWGGSIPATLIYQPHQDVYDFKEAVFTHEKLYNWVKTYL